MTVLFIIIAAVIVIILELFLSKRGARGITVEISPETDAAEPGEEFRITLRITNNSRWLFPFVKFKVLLPQSMEIKNNLSVSPSPPNSIVAEGSAVLMPRGVCVRVIEASCPKRGNYRFGNVSIEVGDFLGMKEYRNDFVMFRSVSVYPVKSEGVNIDEALGGVMGDYSVRRFIYEDPVLVTGFRQYTGREPMKSISWMQTARTGSLMVKKYDFTSEPSVTVVLDTDNCEPEEIEKSFSLARAVCEELESRNTEYDFFMNCDIGGVNCSQHYFAKGMGSRHLFGILYQLANATYSCSFSGDELLQRLNRSQNRNAGIIMIRKGEVSYAGSDIH